MGTPAFIPPKDPTRHLQQQLHESAERYALVAKATNDVIYDLDLRSASVVWNEALYTQYGYKRSEPANTLEWWTRHIHPEDAIRIENELTHWLGSGEDTWHSEYRFQKADGSYAAVRDRAFVLRGPAGEPLRIIGSFLDITQQKELERAKDEFISLVSHQLRTPLTIIRMSADILAKGMAGPLNDAQRAYAAHITDASVRLIRLVGNILNISRVELDRVTIEPEPGDISSLIQQSIDELTPLFQEKGAQVTFRPGAGIEPMPLDPIIFSQIMLNLLTNATQYLRQGQGRIAVGLEKQRQGIVVSVSDNGIGIPRSAQPHIFKRFFRAPNAAHVEGTGLGLYLLKLIVHSFGGRIWFESTLHKGTTFFVQIPPQGMQPKAGDRTLALR